MNGHQKCFGDLSFAQITLENTATEVIIWHGCKQSHMDISGIFLSFTTGENKQLHLYHDK